VTRGADADRVTDACGKTALAWFSSFDAAAVATAAVQTFAARRSALAARQGK
jgi:hypothetical protein